MPMRVGSIVVRSLLIVVLLSLSARENAQPVGAAAEVQAPKKFHCVSSEAKALLDKHRGAKVVDETIRQLRQKGATQTAIDSELRTRLCLMRIDRPLGAGAGQTVRVASVNTDLTVSRPAIYLACIGWDCNSYYYYSVTPWKWNNTNYRLDSTYASNVTYNIGGYDGIGTTFNVSQLMRSWSASWWGSWYFGYASTSTTDWGNQNGAGFRFQDKITHRWDSAKQMWRLDNNAYYGQEVITFYPPSSCKSVQAFGRYNHTRSSSSVTGISIGPWSIGFSWTNSTYQWSSGSQPGSVATVCP